MATTNSLMNFNDESPLDKRGSMARQTSLFQDANEEDELSIDLNDGGPICESANFASARQDFAHQNHLTNMVSIIISPSIHDLVVNCR